MVMTLSVRQLQCTLRLRCLVHVMRWRRLQRSAKRSKGMLVGRPCMRAHRMVRGRNGKIAQGRRTAARRSMQRSGKHMMATRVSVVTGGLCWSEVHRGGSGRGRAREGQQVAAKNVKSGRWVSAARGAGRERPGRMTTGARHAGNRRGTRSSVIKNRTGETGGLQKAARGCGAGVQRGAGHHSGDGL